MTVGEVLDAARDAAVEIRRIDEQAELRLQAVGPQGYSLGVHSKNGILDPMRKVDELMDWQDSEMDKTELLAPIDEAWDVLMGAQKVSSDLDVEIVTRYYLQAESLREIVVGSKVRKVPPIAQRVESMAKLSFKEQAKVLERAMKESIASWDQIGIAHLKEMGRQ